MNYLTKLKAMNPAWIERKDGLHEPLYYYCPLQNNEALKVVRVDKEWVIVLLLDGAPSHGQVYNSFKKLANSLTEKNDR